MKNKTALLLTLLVGGTALADIAAPTEVTCTVTQVSPVGALFFGFHGPVVGETTTFDAGASEILRLTFSSGALVGSTVRPHPLHKDPASYEGLSHFSARFISQTTHQEYTAALVVQEDEPGVTIKATLDVVEKRQLGRIVLNSLEMDCRR